jgi:phosphoribosylformylglycinamidine cyclo-ligase
MGLTYKDAGVDIDAGEALVDKIKPLAARTMRPEVRGGIGGFAGLCAIPEGYRRPLLVSGTDGVGTKLKTAFETGRHDTIGIDLVAMAVNDVAVIGAEPLFFLDYFAAGKLASLDAEAVIRGVAEGCQQAGCALLGGETAELPGMYRDGEYELAGFCVGVVEADDVRDGKDIAAGDALIGLASSGLHSNGHSLARKVVFETLDLGADDAPSELEGASVADELLRPTRIYVKALAALMKAGVRYKGAAHITGGGLIDNPPRMLPSAELAVVLDPTAWQVPPIFRLIASAGIEEHEMRRTFNMGLGMLIACAASDASAAIAALAQVGEPAAVVGHVAPAEGGEAVRFA